MIRRQTIAAISIKDVESEFQQSTKLNLALNRDHIQITLTRSWNPKDQLYH